MSRPCSAVVGARYLLVSSDFTALAALARADDRLAEVFADKTCAIFEVTQ